MPIDLPVGEPEDRVVNALEAWRADAGQRLYAVPGGQTPPVLARRVSPHQMRSAVLACADPGWRPMSGPWQSMGDRWPRRGVPHARCS